MQTEHQPAPAKPGPKPKISDEQIWDAARAVASQNPSGLASIEAVRTLLNGKGSNARIAQIVKAFNDAKLREGQPVVPVTEGMAKALKALAESAAADLALRWQSRFDLLSENLEFVNTQNQRHETERGEVLADLELVRSERDAAQGKAQHLEKELRESREAMAAWRAKADAADSLREDRDQFLKELLDSQHEQRKLSEQLLTMSKELGSANVQLAMDRERHRIDAQLEKAATEESAPDSEDANGANAQKKDDPRLPAEADAGKRVEIIGRAER